MSDNQWHKVADAADLKNGVPTSVKVDGKEILLVRVGEKLYATRGKCPHYGVPLKKGLLNGCELTCAAHHARFDLSTGKLEAPPALDGLLVYPTRVEKGEVFVGFPGASPSGAPGAAVKDERTFVVVGGGAAGNAAAETLRGEGFSGRIQLITAENRLPYDRPSLSKDFLSGEASPDWLPLRRKEFYEKQGIEILAGREVRQLNPAEHTVLLSNGDALKYDRILLATGGTPRFLSIPGGDARNIFVLRSADDADAIVETAKQAERVVILGSGFIGLEAAVALRHRGLKVVLATQEEAPMARIFGQRIGQWFRQLHMSQGVQFHFGVTPERVDAFAGGLRLHLSDGTALETDFIVVGFGVSPSVEYLKDTGLVRNGAVTCNERLQTQSEDVFAAGDVAAYPDPHTGALQRIEHWVVAESQGRHAARAMLGSAAPYDEVPFFWTRQYGKSVKYIGHAASYDRVVFRGDVTEESFFAGYFLNGRLLAASGVNAGNELIALGRLLRSGNPPSAESFEDPGFSFIESLSGRS
jgi:NADPH-dependent 2,4-dienoyl-CoA reductase/sulfur reductase-like enzyme/nitrite reductase/ring-hydroxylating ferredoxin subunit